MKYDPSELDDNSVSFVRETDGTSSSYGETDSSCSNELETYESDDLVTSGISGDVGPYIYRLPHDFDVLREANLGTDGLHNENVRKLAEQFLSVFQRVLISNRNQIEQSGYLPPLKFTWLEDGSLLIEWIFKDFRIGFSIEPKEDDSSWYLVSNHNLDEASNSGMLKFNELEVLLVDLVEFVLANA